MKKILFITNIPSPYRIDFFNELGKSLDLTVIFELHSALNRDSSWSKFENKNFKSIFLKGIRVGVESAFSTEVIKYIKRNNYDHIFLTNISSPTTIFTIIYLNRHKIPYIIESDGAFHKNGKGFKERIKKYLISNAKYCFSTGKHSDDYFLHYGSNQSSIFRYPLSSIRENLILNTPLSDDEKKELRKELSLNFNRIIISVGSFIYRKGFDILIKASANLPKDTGVLIIGGTPPDEYKKLVNDLNVSNVIFYDFQSKESLMKYLSISDIFVFPTREDIWGLVINEAMACGLPIIATNKCGAALELVKNDYNGFIVEIDNHIELHKKMQLLLMNDKVRIEMSNNSISAIKSYTIENMVATHLKILEEI